jgi:hypothetical protein
LVPTPARFQASKHVTNCIPLGISLFLPIHTVNCVQTLKAVAVSLTLVWYFIASAPPVLGSVLEEATGGKYTPAEISSNRDWRLAAVTFGSLLPVTIFDAFVAGLACDADGYLHADGSIECWTVGHRAIGAVCLYGSFWFIVTSSFYVVQFNLFGTQEDDKTMQAQTSWPHVLAVHIGKFAMVLVSRMYGVLFRQKFTLEDAIEPTPVSLKRCHACDQWHSSRVSTPRTG